MQYESFEFFCGFPFACICVYITGLLSRFSLSRNICCCTSSIMLFLREATGLVKVPTPHCGLSAVNYSLAWTDGRSSPLFVHTLYFSFVFLSFFLRRTQSPRTRVVLINKPSPLWMKWENSCRKRERRPFLFFLSLSLSLSGGTKEGYRDGRKRQIYILSCDTRVFRFLLSDAIAWRTYDQTFCFHV